MITEDSELFTANVADRLEQQEEVSDEPVDEESDQPLRTATREANEADIVEQAQAVYGEDDYPRGPIDEEPA
jgi:hypothetical protein